MRDRAIVLDRRPRLRKLKLWHLVLVVLLASVVLGGLRSLTRRTPPTPVEFLVGFAGVWIFLSSSMMLIYYGAKAAHRVTLRVMARAVERGGMVGFSVWMGGVGVILIIIVAAILLSIGLIVGLVKLLMELAS